MHRVIEFILVSFVVASLMSTVNSLRISDYKEMRNINTSWKKCKHYNGKNIPEDLKSQMQRVVSAFNECDVKYVLGYGSLLGAIRDHSINPNEIDNDFIVDQHFEITYCLRTALYARGLHIFKDGIYRICEQGSSTGEGPRHPITYKVYSDLYPQLPYMKLDHTQAVFILKDDITILLDGIEVRIPPMEQSKTLLRQQYGNWFLTKQPSLNKYLIHKQHSNI